MTTMTTQENTHAMLMICISGSMTPVLSQFEVVCVAGTSRSLNASRGLFAHSESYANEQLVPRSHLWLCMLKRSQDSALPEKLTQNH